MKKRRFIILILLLTLFQSSWVPVLAYNMGKEGVHNTISCGNWLAGHTAVIKADNSLWMWGNNTFGELGIGTTTDSNVPVKVLDNIVSVSCGDTHTAAIKTDGSLWMWGNNTSGELGNGTTKESRVPTKVLDDVTFVSCGGNFTAALKTNGSLWMWGENYHGELGNGTTKDSRIPVKVLDDIASVSCGNIYTAALKTDGSLWMWGGNNRGQLGNGTTKNSLVPEKVMDNVAAISCGTNRTAALKTDGSLWMWGASPLGNGTTEESAVPVKVFDDIAYVSCGDTHVAAIKADGSLWMWGTNTDGNLGDGTTEYSDIPVKVMNNVSFVSCGDNYTAAVKNDGSLWMWGKNEDGQLGNGMNRCSLVPVKVMDDIAFPTAPGSTHSSLSTKEYIYDTSDPGDGVILNTSRLNGISDSDSATKTVQAQIQSMTTEQKNSTTGADLATLYAETAVSKAASKSVPGNEIIINKAAVSDLEAVATQTSSAVETALVNGGVTTARLVSSTVTLTTDEAGEITIKIDPDILSTQVDKIRVETPTYALTLKVADLVPDLTEILAITAEDVGSGFAAGNQNKKTTVKVNLPKGKTTNPVTVSLPKDSGDTTYQAVVKTDGSATSSKYNPATTTMDGKVNTSGSYTVQTNQKDFTDIANKSAEMQKAIRYLASKGIINGTSATEFSPDGSINRAEIAALLVRALGKLDNSATNSFNDVKSSDWYYATAGSSQKCGLIKGYTDNTFRGTTPIIKDQILAVAARVLKNEMGYKEPSNPASYLAKYSDTVTAWAQPEVALATKENLVVYRYDGTFKGESNMTRGDAAIIIYRLFQKIW